MPETGLYPASEWKSGNNYKAFDWSGYDQEDYPAEVWQQIDADRKKTETPAVKQPSAFEKLVKDRKTTTTTTTTKPAAAKK